MSRSTTRDTKQKTVTTVVRCDNCGKRQDSDEGWTVRPHEVWGEKIWMDYCDECSKEQ